MSVQLPMRILVPLSNMAGAAASPVAVAEASGSRVTPGGQGVPCKLFVGGISAQTTTEALRGHFSRYGRLVDAVVMLKNGRPRGFGFVTYDSPRAAVMALAEPQWLDGRLVDVKRAVPGERPQEKSSNKIFVGGLSQDVTTEDLKTYFSGYGNVADAVVMVDRRTSRSRGFGFIRFANGAHGNAASEAVLIDFASHRLGGKWVEVKRATPAAVLQELSLGNLSDADMSVSASLALMEQHLGNLGMFKEYFMDSAGWDNTSCVSPTGDADTSPSFGGAARGRARGRRGRRGKTRGLLGDSGEEEDCLDELSPCSIGATSTTASPTLSAVSPTLSVMSPMRSRLGSNMSGMSGSPSPGSVGGGAVVVVPTSASEAAVASAHASAVWGGATLPPSALSLGSAPLFPCNDYPAGSTFKSIAGTKSAANREIVRIGDTENDPRHANFAVTSKPPGTHFARAEATPMKIACREDGYGKGLTRESFTREEFLSIEVRPWL